MYFTINLQIKFEKNNMNASNDDFIFLVREVSPRSNAFNKTFKLEPETVNVLFFAFNLYCQYQANNYLHP